MKKLLLFSLIGISSLIAEELPPVPNFEATSSLVEKERSQFVYFSTGVNPLPTFAAGYRKLYNYFGSDLSLSLSLFPVFCCGKKMGIFPIPGINYKQLFLGMGWKSLATCNSVFYLGAETAIYPLGDLTVNAGGLLGWQFRREKRWDFFEIGMNPLLYTNKRFSVMPLGSLTYAFLF